MAFTSFAGASPGYLAMWQSCEIKSGRMVEVDKVAKRILANRAPYEAVEKVCGVPWFFVGCLHDRESGGNFKTHLHNGDSLQGYTHQVPAGRPKVGHGPPFTWTESAIDALTMPGKAWDQIHDWSIARMLYSAESYNGWGYEARGVNSPYVWGATNHQQAGKYIADHVWSSTAEDTQIGVAALLLRLAALDASIAERVKSGAPAMKAPPAPPVKAQEPVPKPPPTPGVPPMQSPPKPSQMPSLLSAILSLFKRK